MIDLIEDGLSSDGEAEKMEKMEKMVRRVMISASSLKLMSMRLSCR